MNFISVIYDLVAVAIVIICTIRGAKDGFAKTAIKAIGYIFAVIAALVIGKVCTSILYTTVIQPTVIEKMESSIANAVDTESVINGIASAIGGLPAVSGFIFDFDGAVESLINSVGLDYGAIAASVEANVIRPVIEALLETFIFALALIILFFVVSIIAKGSKFINEVPVIGKVNSFFGGISGIFNGGVELCVVAFIMELLISAGLFSEYVSESIISKTYIFKWIYFAVAKGEILM